MHISTLITAPWQRLGNLQETTVLEGDFDFKVARQDYYLAKQLRVDHQCAA